MTPAADTTDSHQTPVVSTVSPSRHSLPTSGDIDRAHRRLSGRIRNTPCTLLPAELSPGGARLFAKRDYLQVTGSFKERGAANALLRLSAGERVRGVIAASAGNHALGLAWHGARLGVPVTIVMPRSAARVKVSRCRRLRARVILAGDSFDETEQLAQSLATAEGLRYIHPFDDPDVVAGQGTMGIEFLCQVPDLDAVVVPVGGGGLLGGLVLAIKSRMPAVRIFAVEPAAAPSFAAAVRAGVPTSVEVGASLADGLAVGRVGRLGFELSAGAVEAVVSVDEAEIAHAMKRLNEVEGTKVEGAGAVALAAVLSGKLGPFLGDLTAVVPLCGGNVDADTYSSALRSIT